MIHKVFQDTLKEVGEKKSNTEENLAVCFLLCINLRVLGEGWEKECSYINLWAGNSAAYPLRKKSLTNIFQMI